MGFRSNLTVEDIVDFWVVPSMTIQTNFNKGEFVFFRACMYLISSYSVWFCQQPRLSQENCQRCLFLDVWHKLFELHVKYINYTIELGNLAKKHFYCNEATLYNSLVGGKRYSRTNEFLAFFYSFCWSRIMCRVNLLNCFVFFARCKSLSCGHLRRNSKAIVL